MYQAELLVKAECGTGEGSLWDAENRKLYWLDIPSGEIYLYNPQSGVNRLIYKAQADTVGTVVQRERGGIVAAFGHDICAIDEATGKATVLATLDPDRPTRFNDGKCDPAGRFWVGTMALGQPMQGQGSLFRMDTDGTVTRVLEGVTISNGIIWSNDAKTMYFTDTTTGEIWAYDYDAATGGISNRRVAVKIKPGEGGPDGFTIDSEGMLWVAQWGGWQVGRYNPNTGEKLDMVQVPALQVSSCAFGGDDMDTLFITTARGGQHDKPNQPGRMGEQGRSPDQPHAGSLFCAKVGVKGVKASKFKG